MKYFAILKDSLREALDSKVLYVLLGLALLIVLLVATISFRPLSAEKSIAEIVDGQMIHFVQALRPDAGEAKKKKKKEDGKEYPFAFDFAISDYRLVAAKPIELLRGEPDTPDADYRFTISKMYFNEASAAKVRAQPDAEIEALRKYFARMEKLGFFHIGTVQVVQEAPERPFVEFTVELHSTSGTRRLWVHEPSIFFGAFPLGQLAAPLGFQLFVVANFVVSFGAWIAVLLGVVITSFFIPNMLQK